MKTQSNYPTKMHALKKGAIAAFISLTVYFLIVIITTPNLPALTALSVAIKINWIIVFGLAIAVGSQVYVSNYGKNFCGIKHKRKGILGSSSSTALSSFFSFFSLVPL